MKILRVRRGFTTNSSSASEWVMPGPTPASNTQNTPDSTQQPNSQPTDSVAVQVQTETPQPVRTADPHANSVIIGLISIITIPFIIERLVKKFLAARKNNTPDE